MPDLPLDMLRQMALAGGVLDQDHFAAADYAALTVTGGYFDAGVEIDDVLSARRRVPVDVVFGLRLTEDDTGRRQGAWRACCRASPRPIPPRCRGNAIG